MLRLLAIWIALAALAGPAHADCRDDVFESVPFTVCEADPAAGNLRLWYRDPEGALIGTFDRLDALLAEKGVTLDFAMNGAMYHDDRTPVGLYIEDGQTVSPIALRPGPGNFGLLPNGVFCLSGGTARVEESRAFADSGAPCAFAMQSGPLLVQGGALHPKFLPGSSSVFIRNGVGVRADGTVLAVITGAPLNFHRFARLFRDHLGAPDALFIDGNVSRLYAPALDRHDRGLPFGPMLGQIAAPD